MRIKLLPILLLLPLALSSPVRAQDRGENNFLDEPLERRRQDPRRKLEKSAREVLRLRNSIGGKMLRFGAMRKNAIETGNFKSYKRQRKMMRENLISTKSRLEIKIRGFEKQLRHFKENTPPNRGGDRPDFSHFGDAINEMHKGIEDIEAMLKEEESDFKAMAKSLSNPVALPVPHELKHPRKKGSPLGVLLVVLIILGGIIGISIYTIKRIIRKSVEEATLKLSTPPPQQTPAPIEAPPTGMLSEKAAPPIGTPSEGPGTVIAGNFKIEKQIGKGGMGVVYLAKDETLGREVAIKRMREELVESEPDLKAFLEEARLVASLRHPNLVEIHHVAKEPNRLYLVFEYVEGRSLQKILDTHGKLSMGQAKSVLHQIASALDYAHAKKITHRDLKPSNIMVTNDGITKVMDFGLAHQTQKTIARLSRTGASGTPSYMAPEQELGSTSSASDVFALGVTLYQMVTGSLPYSGPNFLAQKRESIYTLPTKINPELPAAFDEMIIKALNPDPGERHLSAGLLSKSFQSL